MPHPQAVTSWRGGGTPLVTLPLLLCSFLYCGFTDCLEVSTISLIYGVFQGPDFLKSPFYITAAFNDLLSMKKYRNLQPYFPEAFEPLLPGIVTWILLLRLTSSQHCVIRSGVMYTDLALLLSIWNSCLVISTSFLRAAYPDPQFATYNQFWPVNGNLPPLAQFSTINFFLVPNLLEINDDDLRSWFEAQVRERSDRPASLRYKPRLWSSRIEATNDCSER